MFETLFSRPDAIQRHHNGPRAVERATYLAQLAAQGTPRATIRIRAHYCLRIVRELEHWPPDHQFTPTEIDTMAVAWATQRVASGKAGTPEYPERTFRSAAVAFLRCLSNTGARATEAAQTNVGALHLDTSPASVRFLGKGRKVRLCPLWSHTVDILRGLLGSRLAGSEDTPVFLNVRRQRLTRFGVHTLVERTVAKAARTTPALGRKQVSPHTIRHTTAVHLLRAGVDMNTIRAGRGYVSLETTNRYAQVDLAMQAKALETCAPSHDEHSLDHTAAWHQDRDLMIFLASL